MIETYIKKHKLPIESALLAFLQKKGQESSSVNRWGSSISEHLKNAVLGGKMIRGVLIVLGYELSEEKIPQDIYTVAAAYELFHSGFLIHDDVIDGDSLRRGKPTMHIVMKDLMNKNGIPINDHYGESLAIGVGDIAFFGAYELLLSTTAFSSDIQSVARLLSKEMANVGLGEIDDVILGLEEKVDKEAILNCYLYKTARYTFSVPVAIGGQLGGLKKEDIHKLEDLGELLGIVFQLKDDELGILGNSEETGKGVGGDIREGKKTLYYYYLFTHATADEQKKLKAIFGNKDATSEDIVLVQNLIHSYGIDKKIQSVIDLYIQKVEVSINALNVEKNFKELFNDLMGLITHRSR